MKKNDEVFVDILSISQKDTFYLKIYFFDIFQRIQATL